MAYKAIPIDHDSVVTREEEISYGREREKIEFVEITQVVTKISISISNMRHDRF